MVSYKPRYEQLTEYDGATKYKYNDRARNADKKCIQYGWQNFVFVIHPFSNFSPTLSYTLQHIQGKENGIIVARGMQQEHIQ